MFSWYSYYFFPFYPQLDFKFFEDILSYDKAFSKFLKPNVVLMNEKFHQSIYIVMEVCVGRGCRQQFEVDNDQYWKRKAKCSTDSSEKTVI